MSDLISRDWLKTAIHNFYYGLTHATSEADIQAYIDAAPSVTPKIIDTIDFAIDASNGDTNYFVGFRNGLRYAKSLIDGEEPEFDNCAAQESYDGYRAGVKYVVEKLRGRLYYVPRDWMRTKNRDNKMVFDIVERALDECAEHAQIGGEE